MHRSQCAGGRPRGGGVRVCRGEEGRLGKRADGRRDRPERQGQGDRRDAQPPRCLEGLPEVAGRLAERAEGPHEQEDCPHERGEQPQLRREAERHRDAELQQPDDKAADHAEQGGHTAVHREAEGGDRQQAVGEGQEPWRHQAGLGCGGERPANLQYGEQQAHRSQGAELRADEGGEQGQDRAERRKREPQAVAEESLDRQDGPDDGGEQRHLHRQEDPVAEGPVHERRREDGLHPQADRRDGVRHLPQGRHLRRAGPEHQQGDRKRRPRRRVGADEVGGLQRRRRRRIVQDPGGRPGRCGVSDGEERRRGGRRGNRLLLREAGARQRRDEARAVPEDRTRPLQERKEGAGRRHLYGWRLLAGRCAAPRLQLRVRHGRGEEGGAGERLQEDRPGPRRAQAGHDGDDGCRVRGRGGPVRKGRRRRRGEAGGQGRGNHQGQRRRLLPVRDGLERPQRIRTPDRREPRFVPHVRRRTAGAQTERPDPGDEAGDFRQDQAAAHEGGHERKRGEPRGEDVHGKAQREFQ